MIHEVFAPLVGQSAAIELLIQAVNRDRIAPAYLFAGPDGVGRSLAARCFAALLLHGSAHRIHQRNHPDLLWVEPTYLHQGNRFTAQEAAEKGLMRKTTPLIRLEQIREISQFLSRPPLEAPRSLVVLEQAETMPEAAANALLKTLEEPGRATLILLAPSTDALLPTLVSRCQRIPFYRLSETDLLKVLQRSAPVEILNYPELLTIAQGSPGAAIAAFNQLQQIPDELLRALCPPPKTLREALELAQQIAKGLELDTQIWLASYLQQRYWQASLQANQLSDRPLKLLEQARKHLRGYVQPRLVWEVTLMALQTDKFVS